MKTILAAAMMCAGCSAQSVTIVNSGSTNTPGYQIVVPKSGQAEYTAQPPRIALNLSRTPQSMRKTIPDSLVKSLYADVEAARPLASLPPRGCMKSASFGTRLTIQLGDDKSPDLSCGDGGNSKMRALIRDTNSILKIFDVQ